MWIPSVQSTATDGGWRSGGMEEKGFERCLGSVPMEGSWEEERVEVDDGAQ